MDLFKEFFKSHTPTLSLRGGVQRRHRNPLGTTDVNRHYRRKHLNLVPDMYKAKEDANPKIETLKKGPGRFVCNTKDLQYITRKFLKGLPPKANEMKMLGGKMGIKLYHDINSGKWIIEKN